jgi:hypothetical protein
VTEDDVFSRDTGVAKVLRDGFPERNEVRRWIASRIPVLRRGEKSSYGIGDAERIRSQGTIHDPPGTSARRWLAFRVT